MAPASLPVVAGNGGALENARNRLVRENRDRARQTKVDEEELCRATPVATVGTRLARCRAEAKRIGLCICNNLMLHRIVN